jgi:hypothetical protein
MKLADPASLRALKTLMGVPMLETAVTTVADRRSLGMIGYILSGVAVVVIGVGIFVVQANLTGRYVLDDPDPVVSNSLPTIAR